MFTTYTVNFSYSKSTFTYTTNKQPQWLIKFIKHSHKGLRKYHSGMYNVHVHVSVSIRRALTYTCTCTCTCTCTYIYMYVYTRRVAKSK